MRRPPVIRRIAVLLCLVATSTMAGCFHFFYSPEVKEVVRPAVGDGAPTRLRASLRAHMADGSTAIFPDSAWINHDSLWGLGYRTPLLSSIQRPISQVPLDSVLAVESFRGRLDQGTSVVVSLAATAITPIAFVGMMVAIFGSCPTVYADTGGGLALEAEGFSYSISPMFERRDLDRVRVKPGADGIVQLELRNEAMETHFINHVELLAVHHDRGVRVAPDHRGAVVALREVAPITRAVDRAGRDVTARLVRADGDVYATAPAILESARAGDFEDWIDLEVSNLPPGDSVAVLLRLRNSLLNTILLYEGMLGGRDAPAWLEVDMSRPDQALALGRWYGQTMGMRASVVDTQRGTAASAVPQARLGDVGPIAFRDVALVLPRAHPNDQSVRVRLQFVADNWRIDAIEVSGRVERPQVTVLPTAAIDVPTPAAGGAPVRDTAGVRAIRAADAAYLETRPGQRVLLRFALEASPARVGDETTYLLAWQGWYREWIRGSWLKSPTRSGPFVPGDSAVLTALARWRTRQASFEQAFYASRVPVR